MSDRDDGLLPAGWSSMNIAEQQLRDALRAWDDRDRARSLDRALVLAHAAHKLLIELDSDREAECDNCGEPLEAVTGPADDTADLRRVVDTRASGSSQGGRDRGNRCAPPPPPQGSTYHA